MTTPARRTFLARLAAAATVFGIGATPSGANAEPITEDSRVDDPWTRRLSGTQRVIFHSHEPTNGLALTWARTFLDTQKASYARVDADCGVVVALNGKSVGLVFNDVLWSKYPIGTTLGMT
ncbi:MAG: hypothetical protein ABMA00_13195, partial [Gemmatimonas sp.]